MTTRSVEAIPEGKPPQSEILFDGRPTGTVVAGAVFEAAVEAQGRYLLFMTDDVPYEDGLSIHLLDARWRLLDTAWLGAAYTTGTFSDLRLEGPRRALFRFFGDCDWSIDILPRPQARLPFPAEAAGLHRRFGFKRHFVVRGKPRPGEQLCSAGSVQRRFWPLSLFLLLGIAVGMALGALNIAFAPVCGEECVNEGLRSGLRWAALLMSAFPLLAYLATRNPSAHPGRRYWLIAGGLCLATLLPALIYHVAG